MNPKPRQSLRLPPVPRTQALTSTSFCPPPLDGSLSVPELYDWHYTNSPNHPLFVYSDTDGGTVTITWKEVVRAVHDIGRKVRILAQERIAVEPSRLVFAILASSDSIMYFTLIAAICRAGHVAFPISPRNSPAAVAHLLSRTNAAYVFVGFEDALHQLIGSAMRILRDSGDETPVLAQFPSFLDSYVAGSETPFEMLPQLTYAWDDPVVILHSSGSTSFPKPLVYNHERFLLSCLAPWFGERDLTGQRLACHSMPMYHGMGLMQVGWTAFSGLVLTVFMSTIPATVPTPESVIKGAMDTKSDLMFCVPSFVEEWAKQPRYVDWLRQIQGIIYGGGPLAQVVGDFLTEQGVTIFAMYGNSECGINSIVLPKHVGTDWQYFAFPKNIRAHFVSVDHGSFELVLMCHQLQKPCVINTEVNGVSAYATSDLLSPHPTKPGYWKILGRLDDQIMHSTGEKTNPGPLETILVQDPHIQSALIFGRGRFNAGILIDPTPSDVFDPRDEDQLAAYRNKIWPTVEKMNDHAPQHSRIFKEMILVSSQSKPFTYTAKNTTRRQAILCEYAAEIDALYAAVDEMTQSSLPPPVTWDLSNTQEYVREIVHQIHKHHLGDADDFFQNGCDSLQATWIRNTLLRVLRDVTNTRLLPNGFVYQHPSISSLSVFLSAFVTSTPRDLHSRERTVEEMHNLVDKYSTGLPIHTPSTKDLPPQLDSILLTGTTGILGTALLIELFKSPGVGAIYALNRRGGKSVMERQRSGLRRLCANDDILSSTKITWVEIDTSQDSLGIPSHILKDMRGQVTHIIHNAWLVDFNQTLRSFEPSIRMLRALVDLALCSSRPSPPRLIFCSSIGVLYNLENIQPLLEIPAEATAAIGNGYSESKWVAESLLRIVSAHSSLRPITIRIGQLSGSNSGFWNPNEWFPSLVRSSISFKCFPDIDKNISLLPVEDAARAIYEMRNTEVPILHLSHPHPFAWSDIVDTMVAELGLQTVSYDMWFSLLKKSAEALTADAEVEVTSQAPSLKLIDFFTQAGIRSASGEAMGMPRLDTSAARMVSPFFRDLPPLPKDTVSKWIRSWRESGFFE